MSTSDILRDRVTAILTLADKAEPPEPWNLRSFHRDIRWLAEWALEALDTIDKARELHQPKPLGTLKLCTSCWKLWPCPDWQALNGGNEQ